MLPDFAQSIAGSLAMGLGSLVLSILAFAGIVLWVVRLDKNDIRMISELPLDPQDALADHSEQEHR